MGLSVVSTAPCKSSPYALFVFWHKLAFIPEWWYQQWKKLSSKIRFISKSMYFVYLFFNNSIFFKNIVFMIKSSKDLKTVDKPSLKRSFPWSLCTNLVNIFTYTFLVISKKMLCYKNWNTAMTYQEIMGHLCI